MQFHLDGFRPGDPDVAPDLADHDPAQWSAGLPDHVDVLIVGGGPAGLTLAAQLAQFPSITTRIVEQKPGPMQLGQADGIACRTMEMFEAFGFRERVQREAYWVNETVFWKPDDQRDGIVRGSRIQDVEDGLSELPHVILTQARVHDRFLEVMRNAPTRLQPDYARRLRDLQVAPADGDRASDPATHPVTATLERVDLDHAGQVETVRARYVVGCDGARSTVRRSLGLALHGDSANRAWGVMDVLAVTDFPDIRFKAVVHSADRGTVLVIPREGGYLVRLYIELDELDPDERVANRNLTVDHLIAAAQRILHPYTLQVAEVAWWSVYEIGQRLCDRFDDVPDDERGTRAPRVFITGDACHTHSPKAGQGMNVSMRDSFNLGWKLASVLLERSVPALLDTYSAERQVVARELIDFDREFAKMMGTASQAPGGAAERARFDEYFARQGRFTAGTATRYQPSLITGEPTHQHLAEGLPVGMRFHSAPVIRLADAKPVHLGHVVVADGRWRIFAFAGADDPTDPSSGIAQLCAFLAGDADSPVRRCTPAHADVDAMIDVRAVVQQSHRDVEVPALPALLRPRKGRYGLIDYQKAFSANLRRCTDPVLRSDTDIYDRRGIDREGCVVVVRPDQHVAGVLPLDAHDELAAFFDRFMIGAH
jgi:phenol 2-monooxygenase